MTRFAIDLSNLPFPAVIQALSFEDLLAEMKAHLQRLAPFVDVESEPIVMFLETVAYHRLKDMARVNDAAKAVFVAYATGPDLDNLAAFFGVARLVIRRADPDANPPLEAILEADSDLRARVLLSLEAQSAAGPRGAYLYHAKSADSRVLDVSVVGPSDPVPSRPPPGTVWVWVLSRESNGAASIPLLNRVAAALNAEDVRPLCDTVLVMAARVIPYTVSARLRFYPGPDRSLVMAAARKAVDDYVAANFLLGRDISRSGLMAALHQPGVQNVNLLSPAQNVLLEADAVARCTGITVEDEGIGI